MGGDDAIVKQVNNSLATRSSHTGVEGRRRKR